MCVSIRSFENNREKKTKIARTRTYKSGECLSSDPSVERHRARVMAADDNCGTRSMIRLQRNI